MHKIIVLAALLATVSCKPQLLSKPHTFRPPPRISPAFLNAATAPLLNNPETPLNLPGPARKAINLPPQAPTEREVEANDYELFQNQNARYEFSSNIEDHINDQTQQREEVRDGASVKGSYSYSDGYYKRTVNYIADENGYRVTGMEVEPLDGPHVDLMGTASVSNSAHGTQVNYRVVSVPVPGPVAKIVDQ